MRFPQSQTFSPPKIQKKTGGIFSFDFIRMNAYTFDELANYKDAIHILITIKLIFISKINEGRKDGKDEIRKACFFAIVRIFFCCRAITVFFLKSMKEEKLEKMKLEKRASLLSLE